ncbi:MAG: endonuclease/exonuclease/phosphatase family protein, partial [Pirellulaceae bacterium]
RVFVRENDYLLPRDAIQVFGSDHPFLEDVSEDLITLAALPESGDMVLVGWTNQVQSTSFVLQNGAHAGPGIEETRGFALLPCDAPVGKLEKRFMRPDDLRAAGLRFLDRDDDKREFQPLWSPPAEEIRLLTYNVHACMGMDGQLSAERIARVISQSGANIICLQELDVNRRRSGQQDQAHMIAQHLEMDFHFHPAWHVEEERFGNAILTRFPMRVVQAEGLHHYKADRSRRSALWVEIDVDEHRTLQVINAHTSMYPKEQLVQARQLWDEWVQPASLLGPVVLCGDFNARPTSAPYKLLAEKMLDIETFNDRPSASRTLFSPLPISRVDHIFVTSDLHAENSRVINSRLAQIASDHLPLIADFKFTEDLHVADNADQTTTSPDGQG